MRRSYIAKVILNFSRTTTANPGDTVLYEDETCALSVFRGGKLVSTVSDISPQRFESFIKAKWLTLPNQEQPKHVEAPDDIEEEDFELPPNFEVEKPLPASEVNKDAYEIIDDEAEDDVMEFPSINPDKSDEVADEGKEEIMLVGDDGEYREAEPDDEGEIEVIEVEPLVVEATGEPEVTTKKPKRGKK